LPIKTFSLGTSGSLDIEWDRGWINMRVHVNKMAIGLIPTKDELEEGRSFKLLDEAVLHVQRKKRKFGNDKDLVINLNGKPVKGSSGDPFEKLYTIAGMLILLGIANIVFGILSYYIKDIQSVMGYYNIIFGAMYIVLIIWIMGFKSYVGLAFAILLVVANIGLALYNIYLVDHKIINKGFIAIALIIAGLVRGFPALKMIKEEELDYE
jgi:hypothetical protein